jgi:hypothetical protein
MSGSPFRHSNARLVENEDLYSKPVKFTMATYRLLLTREQAENMLQLLADEVQHLIDTRQITPIYIEGHERFCSLDLGRLIDHYLHAAKGAAA